MTGAAYRDVSHTHLTPAQLAEIRRWTLKNLAVESNRQRPRRERIQDGAVKAWGGEGR